MKPAHFATTHIGDKILFRASGPHWFTNRIENAKKLTPGATYTVKAVQVASSSCAVKLEEFGELDFELYWFDHPNPHPQNNPPHDPQ
jgi:hypothetical protein